MTELRIFGLPTLGALSLGALGVCLASGAVVLTGYDAGAPIRSILTFELERPYGGFFRALHAWSGDLFLVALLGHTVEHLVRRADRDLARPLSTWTLLVLALPVALYLAIGGYALTGDAEGRGVASVMRGLLALVPVVGGLLADVSAGTPSEAGHALLAHHVATATLALVAITVVHLRRVVADTVSNAAALGLAGLLALTRRPALGPDEAAGPLHGPWFMGGLRWLLERTPAWLFGQLVPVALLVALVVLPRLSDRTATLVRRLLGAALAAYLVLTLVAAVPR